MLIMKRLLIIILCPFLMQGQGNESTLNGTWDIISLEYSTDIDLSFIPQIGPLIGTQTIAGEANDAGQWNFQYPEYLYDNDVSFNTEPITILTFEAPSIPIDISSNGTWELINNGNTISTTDALTGLISNYEIDVLFDEFAIISGTVGFNENILGYEINEEIELELQLQKQTTSSLNDIHTNQKKIITIVDVTGKNTHQSGLKLYIYNDGSVEKKYIVD